MNFRILGIYHSTKLFSKRSYKVKIMQREKSQKLNSHLLKDIKQNYRKKIGTEVLSEMGAEKIL